MDFNTENRISLADDDEVATPSHGANIKVVGIGGGGVNAVNNMLAAGLKGIEFIAINTDAKSLAGSRAQVKVQISTQRRQGLGAGGDPVIGAQAATEHTDAILDHLHGADMVFIATGLGGGTGTGAAPVIASLAAQIDALVVGVVTQPFSYEGAGRITRARQGLEELRKVADAVIVIPNDRIRPLLDPNQSLLDGFKKADDILRQAVQGVTDLITQDGYINLDFQDVRVALKGRGLAVMGIGAARGEGRGSKAALAAVKNPLLDEVKLAGAQALLINLTGNPTTADVDEVRAILGEATPADLKIGYCFNEALGDELRVTIIAAGFDSPAPVPPRITVEPIKRFTPPELAMDESLYKGGGNPYEKVNASTNAARFEIPSFFRNKKQP